MAEGTAVLNERLRLLGWAFALIGLAVAGSLLWCLLAVAVTLIPLIVGVPLTISAVLAVRSLADRHRRWAAEVMGVRIERRYRTLPDAGSFHRLVALVRDPATWRDQLWVFVNSTAGILLLCVPTGLFLYGLWGLAFPLLYAQVPEGTLNDHLGLFRVTSQTTSLLFIPVGLLSLLMCWAVLPSVMRSYALLTRAALAPERFASAERVRHLTKSRADVVNHEAAEMRRIERDLHDGAQARLVALGMSLGMARTLIETDPEMVKRLLDQAKESSNEALAELRRLVRGIRPPILADRGLPGAVQALAVDLPITVDVSCDLNGRPPEPVESSAYFAVAEALTNAARHSGASQVRVRISHDDYLLRIVVEDNGRGGATIHPDGGIAGTKRRLAAFDGNLTLESPNGGPTTITMEIPCELSSPRT